MIRCHWVCQKMCHSKTRRDNHFNINRLTEFRELEKPIKIKKIRRFGRFSSTSQAKFLGRGSWPWLASENLPRFFIAHESGIKNYEFPDHLPNRSGGVLLLKIFFAFLAALGEILGRMQAKSLIKYLITKIFEYRFSRWGFPAFIRCFFAGGRPE